MRKLDAAGKWLASMCKRMIDACEQEIQVTEKAKADVASLKENFHVELANVREDSHARFTGHGMGFHWPGRKIGGYGMNFGRHVLDYMARDLQTEIKERFSRSKLEMRS